MDYLYWVAGAMMAWGLWGFIPKMGAGRFDNMSWMYWSWMGAMPIVGVCLYFLRYSPGTGDGMWYLPMLTGACGLSGGLMYYKAMTLCGPNTATVIVVSSMYPVISVTLSLIFLREKLNFGQAAGILLCLCGALVLAYFTPRAAS